jgi:UDP-glucose 4-epimerase
MTQAAPLKVLVTGGAGFLGRAVARAYRQLGHHVVGIGHAHWTLAAAVESGYVDWYSGSVDREGLSQFEGTFDVVVHCAGNGSVPFSMTHPREAFERTVQTTVDVLEFCRAQPKPPMVVYPSSAAVYGAAPDQLLTESSPSNPVSPYGYHKRMVEDLLASYASHSGIRAAVIRFFSIYGAGLNKQLLWDASNKLCAGDDAVTFWGTGEETRDWIHVRDAAQLVVDVSRLDGSFTVLNGGSGQRVTVLETLSALRRQLQSNTEIKFNGVVRPGDPRYYHADMSRAVQMGWRPTVQLEDGFKEYAQWFRGHR